MLVDMLVIFCEAEYPISVLSLHAYQITVPSKRPRVDKCAGAHPLLRTAQFESDSSTLKQLQESETLLESAVHHSGIRQQHREAIALIDTHRTCQHRQTKKRPPQIT